MLVCLVVIGFQSECLLLKMFADFISIMRDDTPCQNYLLKIIYLKYYIIVDMWEEHYTGISNDLESPCTYGRTPRPSVRRGRTLYPNLARMTPR